MRIPLLERLLELDGRSWLHMPGHGGEMPWLRAALDMTEIEATDDLNDPAPDGPIDRAQRLAAQACGAGATLFLTGGGTQGMHAMLTAYVPPGGKLILPRNAHKSAIAACAIGDIRPIYVWPSVRDGRAILDCDALLGALERNPDADALLVTRPDYYGHCPNIAPAIRRARAMGIAILVDEAHGAHLPYGGDIPCAGALGADAWVHGAHKTLPAMTQAAYLHVRDPADAPMLRERASLLGTSSPSFLIAASLDWARAQMQRSGAKWIADAQARNNRFFSRVNPLGIADGNAALREAGDQADTARIVADVRSLGISGYRALSALSERGIDVEMADAYRLVALPPLCAGDEALRPLEEALCAMRGDVASTAAAEPPFSPPVAPVVLTPRRAVFSRWAHCDWRDAVGRISARAVGPYPPGVPSVMPGERIDREMLDHLDSMRRQGCRLFGLTESGGFCCVAQ